MHPNYLEELKNCITEQDVKKLFENAVFPNRGKSGFFDKKIMLIGSANVIDKFEVKLNGIIGLAFRVIIYMKLNGDIGKKPQNSGESTYFNQFHKMLKDFKLDYKNIHNISDIDSFTIEEYIENEKENNKPDTMYRKLMFLNEWEQEANENLPYFLRLNDNLIENANNYSDLLEQRKIQLLDVGKIGGTKESYPLNNIKIIIADSIKYIESYSDEILKVSRFLIKIKKFNQHKRYSELYDYFKKDLYSFKEPKLKELQKEIQQANAKYLNDNGINKGRSIKGEVGPIEIIYRVIEYMEVSCIAVALMLMGMRVGELFALERKLILSEDEHFNLTRIVYKTAATEDGETLTMPIPGIGVKALKFLSKLATIKDGKNTGPLVLIPIETRRPTPSRTNRANTLINRYCDRLGISTPPTPHQFRHAMAFLIVHINEKDGLELARMFLGHTSINMTLQYMGHYNNELKEAIKELTKDESELMVNVITNEIRNNKKMFGKNGERLSPKHKFTGIQADEFIKLLRKGLLKLIEEQKLAIIQTPVCLCMHDLSEPETMACQIGFNINEIAANGPAPSNCKGANCASAIFFEEHVEKLKKEVYEDIEPKLRARLEENTYFMQSGGFENEPYRRIIKEYDEYKEEVG